MLTECDYNCILSKFPAVDGYNYSKDNTKTAPMFDFIFAVADPVEWHEENMLKNSSHYSSILNPITSIKWIQGEGSSGVAMWFNVDVPVDISRLPGRTMKYGVIKTSNMLKDMLHWQYLYVSGRLHKPVHIITTSKDSLLINSEEDITIGDAFRRNREFALRVVLLTLPESFSEFDLYLGIAGLSYRGDPRMYISENPDKVMNMVRPNISHFRDIYTPLLAHMPTLTRATVSISSQQGEITKIAHSIRDYVGIIERKQNEEWAKEEEIVFQQSKWEMNEKEMWRLLPRHLVKNIPKSDLAVFGGMGHEKRGAVLDKAIWKIVSRAAIPQTLKGLLCVGASKGGSYFLAKLLKRFRF